MVSDLNKGITDIDYNHLNLPTSVDIDGGTIDYIYDATGIKLKKTVSTGAVTEYAGNYVYSGNNTATTLQFFSHPEGYVNVENNGYRYVYQYSDHLGNVRVSYKEDPTNPGSPTIIEENNYYPFGLEHKGYNNVVNGTEHKWKYQGKEHEEELGLNTYDFGARNYMPDLGRWTTIDPLAEDFVNYTPYNAMMNNPIMFVDPDGMAAYSPIYDTDGNFLGTDDEGLQGKAIVMDKENFVQGMSHNDALKNNKGVGGLSSNGAGSKLLNHYSGLKDRPDYDGFVTIAEGIDWAKSHPNADFKDPNNSLYLDASKLDFGNLNVNELSLNEYKSVNLLNTVDMSKWSSIHTTYALGNTEIKLINSQKKQVQLKGDIYDWDYHNYDPKSGKIPSSKRDRLILLERLRTGINDSHGFPLKIYGTGKLD